jgi:hypothetical protein
MKGRHDTQHDDTQHNDTQRNDTKQHGAQHNADCCYAGYRLC